jgi:hypothetical protein
MKPQLVALFPSLCRAAPLKDESRRLYIGAYGAEERALGWLALQAKSKIRLKKLDALLFQYVNPHGLNQGGKARALVRSIGGRLLLDQPYDHRAPRGMEESFDQRRIKDLCSEYEEIVIDISGMTKLMMLSLLIRLAEFKGRLRIVYGEAMTYGPSRDQFEKHKYDISFIAGFPSAGASEVCSLPSLSSVRMQGQPISLIAFLSFNEQLIRHLVGSISPHRLILLNGRPPREGNRWREVATLEIHKRLVEEYSLENPLLRGVALENTISTLHPIETVSVLEKTYQQYGFVDRIVVGATGSKMQTVGLAFFKFMRPDVNIEYPLPDSYFPGGFGEGLRYVWELTIPSYTQFVSTLAEWELFNS